MQTVNDIRLVVLGKRHALGLSQEQVALRAGVSRKWLSEFERGKAKAELGLVLRLLDSLDLEFSVEPKRAIPMSNANIDLDKLLSEHQS